MCGVNEPAVFVDPLQNCVVTEAWKYPKSCHLFCNPGDEVHLHRFARKIGLKRQWYQDAPKCKIPHYDLNDNKRAKAVAGGATEVKLSEYKEIREKWIYARRMERMA